MVKAAELWRKMRFVLFCLVLGIDIALTLSFIYSTEEKIQYQVHNLNLYPHTHITIIPHGNPTLTLPLPYS